MKLSVMSLSLWRHNRMVRLAARSGDTGRGTGDRIHALAGAAAAGDADRVHLWAGTGFPACRARPAAEIVESFRGL